MKMPPTALELPQPICRQAARAGSIQRKSLVGIDPGVVAIAPAGLQRITADQIPAAKLKTLIAITDSWPNDFTHHVRLAAAGRTGTGAAQKPDRQKGLAPVIPFDRKLPPDLLDIRRLEAHEKNLTAIWSAGQPFAHRGL